MYLKEGSRKGYYFDILNFVSQEAFRAGQHFAKHFPQSMNHVSNMEVTKQQEQESINNMKEKRAVIGATSSTAAINQGVVGRSVLAGFHFSKSQLITRGTGSVAKKDGHEEVHQFMRGIMDECTHLRNFSIPVDTDLIIAVAAQADGYVPRDDCAHLADIWPGAEVRYLDAGHVSAFLLYQNMFRYVTRIYYSSILKKDRLGTSMLLQLLKIRMVHATCLI